MNINSIRARRTLARSPRIHRPTQVDRHPVHRRPEAIDAAAPMRSFYR